jgi:RNA polymerase sigma factor (sigma-70 family)
MNVNETSALLHTLFRSEFSRMVAVISRLFGLEHIELAEDLVSETFLRATETWPVKGIPPNPTAWLYAVAKQKTLYHFRRDKIFSEKVVPALAGQGNPASDPAIPDFSLEHIRDSQLQMLFAVCDPVIASEAQIGLALRVLCGFTPDEVAAAFLTNKETIQKRLYRARERLKQEKIRLELPSDRELVRRLDNVLLVIYLLFNEGYSSSGDQAAGLRREFCLEAIRLGLLLVEYPETDTPKTNALLALMCFHASRFAARECGEEMILYDDQDETLWNQELIAQGSGFLKRAARGSELSAYHLEAGIAYWHCQKTDSPEKWDAVLQHYDLLLRLNYTPMGALNRLYALFKARGARTALAEAEKGQLTGSHYYHTLLGEIYRDLDPGKAEACLQKALLLAVSGRDRKFISEKLERLKKI